MREANSQRFFLDGECGEEGGGGIGRFASIFPEEEKIGESRSHDWRKDDRSIEPLGIRWWLHLSPPIDWLPIEISRRGTILEKQRISNALIRVSSLVAASTTSTRDLLSILLFHNDDRPSFRVFLVDSRYARFKPSLSRERGRVRINGRRA